MKPPEVLSVIIGHAGTSPDRPAVKDLDRELTYAELAQEVDGLASGLIREGVEEGDRVALHLPNSVDFVVAALACLRMSAIFVPLAVTDPVARVDAILADSAVALVLTGPEREEKGGGNGQLGRTR